MEKRVYTRKTPPPEDLLTTTAALLSSPRPGVAMPPATNLHLLVKDYHKHIVKRMVRVYGKAEWYPPTVGRLFKLVQHGLLEGEIVMQESPTASMPAAFRWLVYVRDTEENRKLLIARIPQELLKKQINRQRFEQRWQHLDALADELLQPVRDGALPLELYVEEIPLDPKKAARPRKYLYQLNLTGLLDIGPLLDLGLIRPQDAARFDQTLRRRLRDVLSGRGLDAERLMLRRLGRQENLLVRERKPLYSKQDGLVVRHVRGPFFRLQTLKTKQQFPRLMPWMVLADYPSPPEPDEKNRTASSHPV